MKKKSRRAGATSTFSVSVDPETKRALRALADAEFGGNLSALVTDLAQEARRRMAAAGYLRRHKISAVTGAEAAEIESDIEGEVLASRKRSRKRNAA